MLESSGVKTVLDQLDAELIGLVPVKSRIRDIAALLVIWGKGWAAAPTLPPALIVGIVTISAGWFLMSPGMGGGMAAANADTPWKAAG